MSLTAASGIADSEIDAIARPPQHESPLSARPVEAMDGRPQFSAFAYLNCLAASKRRGERC
ncbi:MAG TPA: hypothetical protein VN300_11010, partial [Desulfobacterales bacterium]|nr:hypothetical protein [Desulfobacterales bacterium]